MSFFFTNVVQFFVKEKFDYHYNFVEGKIDISSESDQEADFRFAKWLSKNRKLQGIPPTAFFSGPHKSIGENYIRFCFIQQEASLAKAQQILLVLKKELNS